MIGKRLIVEQHWEQRSCSPLMDRVCLYKEVRSSAYMAVSLESPVSAYHPNASTKSATASCRTIYPLFNRPLNDRLCGILRAVTVMIEHLPHAAN